MTAQITTKRSAPVLLSNGFYIDDRILFDADAYTVARMRFKLVDLEPIPTLWSRIAEGKRRD